ncbi:tRNA (adenosine(37)-N6)-dimethylallyltransferase MiaA [Heyndrickxia sporothermodurans]|uniref:tRNA dimethylallyltransferase n=1 Tax=Heyndrickxia sporothermodurans TaxID=46224 RepID=A0A150KP30_9BACI|nr:tRNA (adenosine(37)-N6)-dimethylallyltransferase MiaA [Heyndrickxia sporothermodurans]KYD00102.1 tRNA delta(2)-isopentenylpyrophosphate transferase [Heyndrickxia sporothermodurans]PTY79704.1 tRNA (adenosine(37)-N6)-dimethylallyltransferase MiaA [Heyndrickxia sporothermodurans]
MEKKKKLIVLIGPTAVGKTELSIYLAKQFNGEIISGDSMQIYKGMDIGTAKIKEEEMKGISHHLIDIKEPDEPFSVAEFQEKVRKEIYNISQKNKMPMIVGGTGLYIQSVIYDYQFSDAPGDATIRAQYEKQAKEEGNESVYQLLEKMDPESAKKIHPNNIRRVIRALEVIHCTGKTATEYQKQQETDLLYDVAIIGLTMERDKLYERINQRVDIMVNEGLIDEVKGLYDRGIRNVQSIQAIGYKELYDYFDGKITLDEAINQLKQNSRRYAKRQLTWFRNKMDVTWFDMTNEMERKKKINEISQFVAGKLRLKSN